MVLHAPPPPQQQPPHPGPTTVVVSQPFVVVQQTGGCNCSVPPNASGPVEAARLASIAIIIVHAIALVFLGFIFWAQWIASLVGIIMGSVLLCQFTKCVYSTAGILFSIGALFDLVAMIDWISAAHDSVDTTVGLFALPPAIGAVFLIAGAVASFIAVCKWAESGSPETMVTHPAGVNVHAPAVIATHVGAAHAQPQQYYPQQHVAKGAPPAHSGTV